MPTYFPQLAGVLAQYPYTSSASYATIRDDMDMGRRYAFSQIGAGLSRFPTEPLYRWPNNYSQLTDAQAVTLETFFDSMAGRFGEFAYLDPGGNLVQYSEDLSHSSWGKFNLSLTASGITDPYGGTRATQVTSSGANGILSTIVLETLVNGTLGMSFCGSVWLRAASSGQSIWIAFEYVGLGTFHASTIALPAGVWKRVNTPISVVPSNSPTGIKLYIGGNNLWGSGKVIDVFGPQVVPMPGPGEYAKTPGNYGYHAKCRFDTDELAFRYLGPNQVSVSAPIVECF